uniref:Uncharacterized protein n=1 Tax=Arundo donax TaxID=35708 RepID=A0A0A9BBE4_ARUDO
MTKIIKLTYHNCCRRDCRTLFISDSADRVDVFSSGTYIKLHHELDINVDCTTASANCK